MYVLKLFITVVLCTFIVRFKRIVFSVILNFGRSDSRSTSERRTRSPCHLQTQESILQEFLLFILTGFTARIGRRIAVKTLSITGEWNFFVFHRIRFWSIHRQPSYTARVIGISTGYTRNQQTRALNRISSYSKNRNHRVVRERFEIFSANAFSTTTARSYCLRTFLFTFISPNVSRLSATSSARSIMSCSSFCTSRDYFYEFPTRLFRR